MRTLATLTGRSDIVLEHSLGGVDALGNHAYTLTLFWFDGEPTTNGNGLIEFKVEDLNQCENIGIWTEAGELSDYDGTVCDLAREMIELLELVGIKVGKDFRPESDSAIIHKVCVDNCANCAIDDDIEDTEPFDGDSQMSPMDRYNEDLK